MGDKRMSDEKTGKKNSENNNASDDKKNSPKKLNKSLKSELFAIALIGEAMIIMLLIFFMVITDVTAQPLDTPLKKWESEFIEYRNGFWYADETLVPTEETVTLISGPYMDLGKGSYTVTVDYECTEEQTCYAPVNTFIQSGMGRLIPTSNKTSFELNINQGVADFAIVVKYNGKGSVKINNIEIKENHAKLGRMLVYLLALFAAADLWFIFEKQIKKNKTIILSLFGIIVMTSIPLFTEGIGKGHDIYFHVMRIEALADSLKHGVFPNRISSLWFDGYGYPASIYYGDILLYIPALMRIIGFPVVASYKIYVLAINLGTAIFSYLSFRCIFKNKYSSLMATLVYMTGTYRLVNVYIRAAVGEYTAMMFLPIIVCGMYKIYTGDMTKKREYFNSAAILAVGMTGLIECHILSTEMVCFMLVVVCLLLFRKTFKLGTIRAFAIAISETLLLTAYFIVPFLDYYKNVVVKINTIVEDPLMIQWQGCSIAEYFAVFRDVFSQYSVHENARLAATPGFILIISIIVGFVVLIYGKKDKSKGDLIIYLVMSVLSLYVASDIFPWDKFAARTSLGRLMSQVQFPWRYVALAVLFSTLVFGWLFEKFEEKDFGAKTRFIQLGAVVGLMIVSLAASMYFDGAYIDDIRFRTWVDGGDIDTWSVGAGEYKLKNFSEDVSGEVEFSEMQTVNLIERSGTKMELYCEGSNVVGTVQVPIFNYKGYVVTDENGNKFEIIDGKNSTIKFRIPPKYKGNITVEFKSPWYWRAAEIVSLISTIALCWIYIPLIKKKLTFKEA